MEANNLIISNVQVSSHQGPDELKGALEGCDVVVIPAGVPRKPGKLLALRFYSEVAGLNYKYFNEFYMPVPVACPWS